MQKFKYFVAVPVWGKSYVNTFLHIALPSLMASGNLPYLAKNHALEVNIYTSEADAETIKQNPLIQELMAQTRVVINALAIPNPKDYTDEHKYRSDMYACKSSAYKDNVNRACAWQEGTGVIVSLNADILFSNNFMQEAAQILATGKKVIEVVGPRGKLHEINAAVNPKHLNTNGHIDVAAADLVDIWAANMHPLLKQHLWNGDSEIYNATYLGWTLPSDKGLFLRCFFLYPIIVVAPQHEVKFSGTIDMDLIANCGYTANDAAVITEQSRLFCCELSEDDKYFGNFGKRGDLHAVTSAFLQYGAAYNFELLNHKVYLGNVRHKEEWEKAAQESDILVRKIQAKARAKARTKMVNFARRVLGKIKRTVFAEA